MAPSAAENKMAHKTAKRSCSCHGSLKSSRNDINAVIMQRPFRKKDGRIKNMQEQQVSQIRIKANAKHNRELRIAQRDAEKDKAA